MAIVKTLFMFAIFAGALFAGTPSSKDSKMLSAGTLAPDFSLLSDKGDTVRLSDFRGKKSVVLIFYPGDQTPGCTKQLCSIRDDYPLFEKKDAVVFGINPADADSHKAFVTKQNYQFPLLVDKDKKVAAAYDANGIFIQRTVYVIDTAGNIVYAKRGMPPDSEILGAIKGGDAK
jgi:thioredoxin-dependent peroxiredoxin